LKYTAELLLSTIWRRRVACDVSYHGDCSSRLKQLFKGQNNNIFNFLWIMISITQLVQKLGTTRKTVLKIPILVCYLFKLNSLANGYSSPIPRAWNLFPLNLILHTYRYLPLAFHSGRQGGHSPPSSAEVKEWVELYLHSPNTPSRRGAQGEHRVNFSMYCYTKYECLYALDCMKITANK